MSRSALIIAFALVAGIVAVYVLPALWIGPLTVVAAICALAFALIVRLSTKTEASHNLISGVLLQIFNFPEQPLAKAKEGWPLTTFLALAAFLVSLGLSVIVRASGG